MLALELAQAGDEVEEDEVEGSPEAVEAEDPLEEEGSLEEAEAAALEGAMVPPSIPETQADITSHMNGGLSLKSRGTKPEGLVP